MRKLHAANERLHLKRVLAALVTTVVVLIAVAYRTASIASVELDTPKPKRPAIIIACDGHEWRTYRNLMGDTATRRLPSGAIYIYGRCKAI